MMEAGSRRQGIKGCFLGGVPSHPLSRLYLGQAGVGVKGKQRMLFGSHILRRWQGQSQLGCGHPQDLDLSDQEEGCHCGRRDDKRESGLGTEWKREVIDIVDEEQGTGAQRDTREQ